MDTQEWFGTSVKHWKASLTSVLLSPDEALEAARASGVGMYRVIDDLHNAITFDLRPDRLRLWVVDGIVSRAACL